MGIHRKSMKLKEVLRFRNCVTLTNEMGMGLYRIINCGEPSRNSDRALADMNQTLGSNNKPEHRRSRKK